MTKALRAASRAKEKVIVTGLHTSLMSAVTMLVFFVAGFLWLAFPFVFPIQMPTQSWLEHESPLVTCLLLLLAGLVGLGVWQDSRRDARPFGGAVVLGICAVATEAFLTADGGLEPHYAFIFLAGVALGAPLGCLTGAVSALTTAFLTASVDTYLPYAMVIAAVVGASGALLGSLAPRVAWVVALPSSFAVGLLVGFLDNMALWPYNEAAEPNFHFALTTLSNLQSLVAYGVQQTLVVDLLRGGIIAVVIAICGLPIISGMREAWRPALRQEISQPDLGVSATALARLEAQDKVESMWKGENS